MRALARPVAFAAAAATFAGAAGAAARPDGNPRDPRQAVTPADQAWAKRISLRRADLPPGWRARGQPQRNRGRCASFVPDLSDLTLTGAAASPTFQRGKAGAGSEVRVFRSAQEAALAFAREARVQLARCYTEDARTGPPLRPARLVAAPRVGERRFALEIVWRGESGRVYLEHVAWTRGRALTAVAFVSAPVPPADALKRRIVSRLDARMR